MGLHGLRFQVWSMCRKSQSLILPLTNKLGTVFAPGDRYLKSLSSQFQMPRGVARRDFEASNSSKHYFPSEKFRKPEF